MKRSMKGRLILAALLLAALLIFLLQLDRESLLTSIGKVPIWILGILAGLQIVSQLLVNLQWHQISKVVGTTITFKQMLYINCQGAIMDSITPGVKIGGEIARVVQISRIANCSGKEAGIILALQKLFSLSTFFFVLIISLVILPIQISIYWIGLLILISVSAAVIICAKTSRHLAVMKTETKMFLLALSFLIWMLYPVKLYILLVQIAYTATALHAGAVAFVSYMVAMIPIFPGGLGGFEGTMVGLLAALGFAISDAAVITILFRFFTFWFVMLVSFLYISFFNFFD